MCVVIVVDERAVIYQSEFLDFVLSGSVIVYKKECTLEEFKRVVNEQVKNVLNSFDFFIRERKVYSLNHLSLGFTN